MRWLAPLAFALAIFGWSAPAVVAMVVTTTILDTSQPPPASVPAFGVPWDSTTVGVNTKNFTYLGNGWALSAWHVGPDFNNGETLTFSTGTVSLIPGQNYTVPNPSGSGFSALTDLRLVRLASDPGVAGVTIASQALSNTDLGQATADVTFVGQGRTRMATTSVWVDGSSVNHTGYFAGPDNTKRWGRNQIANENPYVNENDNDLRAKVTIDFGGGNSRDINSMITVFDQSGISYEAQAVTGDSGSAVFHKNGAQWELIGIVNAMIGVAQNQPVDFAAYGSLTTFADMSYYRGEILNIMNGHAAYSIAGDVNLDGVVSGNGTGPWASDDVTAFIQGWKFQQAQANVTSWKKGDLNLDGITNVADFLLMRSALNSSGLGSGASALSAFFNGSAVPEPASLVLVIGALMFGLASRRPRSRSMA